MWPFGDKITKFCQLFFSRHANEMVILKCATAALNISFRFMKKKNNKDISMKIVYEVGNFCHF